jgi:hypothetical protein
MFAAISRVLQRGLADHRMFAQVTKYATPAIAGTAVKYALLFALVESGVLSAVRASTAARPPVPS